MRPSIKEVASQLDAARDRIRGALKEQLAELPEHTPRTVIGKMLRTFRKALDRKALAAALYVASVGTDGLAVPAEDPPDEWPDARKYLETRRLSWRMAIRYKLVRVEGELFTLTELGRAAALLLRAANLDVLDGYLILTWERLLEACGG